MRSFSYFIAGLVLAHGHLVRSSVCSRRDQRKTFPHRPKTKKAYSELTLDTPCAVLLEPSFQGITDMRRDVFEIGNALLIHGNAAAIVDDFQIMLTLFLAADDRNAGGLRIDAIFNEFSNRFQGIILGQRDDRDGVPIITNAQMAPVVFFFFKWHVASVVWLIGFSSG